MTVAQILAVSIFVVMFVLMVLDKIEKQYITHRCRTTQVRTEHL